MNSPEGERIEMFQKMWNELKLTSKQIGERVGMTRNMVSGIISRAREKGHHFDDRPNPISNPQVTPQPQGPAAPAKAKAPVKPVKKTNTKKKKLKPSPALKQKTVREITLLELTEKTCKAVIGRAIERHGPFEQLPTYCPEPRIEGTPYCVEHLKQYVNWKT